MIQVRETTRTMLNPNGRQDVFFRVRSATWTPADRRRKPVRGFMARTVEIVGLDESGNNAERLRPAHYVCGSYGDGVTLESVAVEAVRAMRALYPWARYAIQIEAGRLD